jgi:hypothetical protein
VKAEDFPLAVKGVESLAYPDPSQPTRPPVTVVFTDEDGRRRRVFLSKGVDPNAIALQLMMLGVTDVEIFR